MGFWQITNHLFNLFLPAFALALLLPAITQKMYKLQAQRRPYKERVAIGALVGCAVILLGLVAFQADGKIATYTLLITAMALSEVVLLKLWR